MSTSTTKTTTSSEKKNLYQTNLEGMMGNTDERNNLVEQQSTLTQRLGDQRKVWQQAQADSSQAHADLLTGKYGAMDPRTVFASAQNFQSANRGAENSAVNDIEMINDKISQLDEKEMSALKELLSIEKTESDDTWRADQLEENTRQFDEEMKLKQARFDKEFEEEGIETSEIEKDLSAWVLKFGDKKETYEKFLAWAKESKDPDEYAAAEKYIKAMYLSEDKEGSGFWNAINPVKNFKRSWDFWKDPTQIPEKLKPTEIDNDLWQRFLKYSERNLPGRGEQ